MALDSSRDKLAIRYENKEIHRWSVCQKPSDDKVRWNSIGVSQWNSTLGVFLGLELCTSCRHRILYPIINFGPQPQWWAWHMSTKGNWRVHNSLDVITTQKCSNRYEINTEKWHLLIVLTITFYPKDFFKCGLFHWKVDILRFNLNTIFA